MRRLIASGSAVLIAMVVLGACGGDSEKPASSDTKPSTTTANTDGSDDNDDFAAKYEAAKNEKFKITYTDNDGDSHTYAQDGEGKSVYSDGDSQFFTSSSGSVACDTDAGGKATCTELPGGSSVSPFLGLFSAGQAYVSVLSPYSDTSSETVADRDATCTTFSQDTIEDAGPVAAAIASQIKGSVSYCVDDETGVLLSMKSTDAGGKTTDSLTVTKFEEPSDSDFEPPAEPSKITIPSVSLPPGVTLPTIPGADQ